MLPDDNITRSDGHLSSPLLGDNPWCMVTLDPNTPDPQRTIKDQEVALSRAAMIMSGFTTQPESPPEPRFEIGLTYATAAVIRWAEENGIDLGHFLLRHHCGDWGDLCDEDKKANEDALKHGSRIFSSYIVNDLKIYCVTEADRALTTLLFSQEY